MVNLVILALICAAFGLRFEGTIRTRWTGFGLMRVGCLAVGMWTYRPGRVFLRIEVTAKY